MRDCHGDRGVTLDNRMGFQVKRRARVVLKAPKRTEMGPWKQESVGTERTLETDGATGHSNESL